MVSLPGDNASNDRVVTTPYATASNAQTTASKAPWSDRKLDKRTSLDSDNAKRRPGEGRRRRRGVYRAVTDRGPRGARNSGRCPVLRAFARPARRRAAFLRKAARRPSAGARWRP